ncbi:porin [Zavarzinia compransoris]|uniref:Porin domain-containing protein n=1 Tax=Zavarzinia compransoris TaxID=1264899 RepID=A0A317E6F0_9PROT|nr:porin [Zavarzinia compransoris]PWR20605.1 hypothetical protein DKG75_11395 [Zavarzinia compransoris]TDP43748.1 putative porin [Zavarzinia compransoris]
MTNKILLGTTALAAILLSTGAQAADDGLKMKVGGYFEGFVLFGDVGGNNARNGLRSVSVDSWNSEVWFIAEAEAANGLKYGFRIELEGASQAGGGDTIDESFLWLEGSFGRIVAGNEDGVGNTLSYKAPTPSKDGAIKIEDQDYSPHGNLIASPWLRNFDSPNHFSGDASKLIYISPRFSGLQFGISYAPDLSEDPADLAVSGGFELDNDGAAGNALELAINYKNKFGDLGVEAAVTYYQDEAEQPSTGALGQPADRQSVAVGGGITYKGFAVGLNYQYTDNYGRPGYAIGGQGAEGRELNQFIGGIQYATGPWSFGIQAGYGKAEQGAREDELFSGVIGGGYNLAPGINVDFGLQYHEWDSTNNALDADATVGLIGTRLSF